MSEIVDPITTRTEEEINLSVGNDSRNQERAGERNDKSYNQLDEKSDYDIYNPALIEDISFSITTKTLSVGGFYPIVVTVNSGEGADPMANTPSNEVVYISSDMSKAYVRDGVLYAVGATDDGEDVTITGTINTKDENGNMISISNTISGITIA